VLARFNQTGVADRKADSVSHRIKKVVVDFGHWTRKMWKSIAKVLVLAVAALSLLVPLSRFTYHSRIEAEVSPVKDQLLSQSELSECKGAYIQYRWLSRIVLSLLIRQLSFDYRVPALKLSSKMVPSWPARTARIIASKRWSFLRRGSQFSTMSEKAISRRSFLLKPLIQDVAKTNLQKLHRSTAARHVLA